MRIRMYPLGNQGTSTKDAANEEPMPKKVLLVDDNPANLYLLERILKSSGLDVVSAPNGKAALAAARSDPPDIIISDILMPVMDGYMLCREWKADEALGNIPFVFYTATYTEPKDEEFALNLGADRFLIKPQDPDVLKNVVLEMLAGKMTLRPPRPAPLGEEMESFRQHNEILFEKLEKKMSDLEAANRKLRLIEERYRLSFENAADVIFTIDTDLTVSSVSPSVERILGYRPREITGRTAAELGPLMTPESFERFLADLAPVLSKGESLASMSYRFIARDGTIKDGEVNAAPLRRDGAIIGLIAVARDITDRRQAEQQLKESERRYRELYDFLPIPVYEMDLKANITAANRAIFETFRGTEDDILKGFNGWTLLSPEDVERSARNIQRLLKGEQIEGTEYNFRRLDGSVFPAIVLSSVIYGQGRPVGLRGAIIDITERRKAEDRLQQTLDSLNRAVNVTVQAMVSAVEARDPYTSGHQIRVADLAAAVAAEMGFSPDRIESVRMAASIHDIGKLHIPAEILSKPRKLTEIEFALIKQHPRIGAEILKNVASSWPLAEIVHQHHERMDGTGYPGGLKGNDILLEARILAVADAVEAMASHRPYRPSLGIDAALKEIEGHRGDFYDVDVADACLRLFREKGYRMLSGDAPGSGRPGV